MDDVLNVFCTVGISLRVGGWGIQFIVIDFSVEKDLEISDSLSCCWSISPSFAGSCE